MIRLPLGQPFGKADARVWNGFMTISCDPFSNGTYVMILFVRQRLIDHESQQ